MFEAETLPQSLYECLEEFLDDTIARFPEMESCLMVADMNQMRVHTRMTGAARERALGYLNSEEVNAKSSAFRSRDGSFTFIVIQEPVTEEEQSIFPDAIKQHLHYVLDHEIAHMGLKNAASKNTFFDEVISECVADAYALLRHYQRYGTQGEVRNLHVDAFNRSRNLVREEPSYGKSHFTAFVLDEIIKHKDRIDFDSLDHQKTMELAWRFAMKNVPPLPVIEALRETYMPVRQAAEREGAEAAIRTLADITLDPGNGYYTFRMGRFWLGRYVEDRALPDGTPLNLPKGYLDDVAKRLKEQEFRLERDDILFNVPTKMRARRPELVV